MPQDHPHIIAIGASTGGVEEINSFFDHTPLDGVSYVIVQHLPPDHKSKMSHLLSRHSKLVVKEVENHMQVQSNEVYVMPENKLMTIQGNRLYLTNKRRAHNSLLAINTFFKSLAEDSGNKAIGVILSGDGNDGTEGIKAIKSAGGMVLVRKPENASFNSMPASAISTGLADYIVEPALMPLKIEDYVKHEKNRLSETEENEKIVLSILMVINEQLSLEFSKFKTATILRRIKRRATFHNFSRLEMYLDFLKTTPGETEALAKEIFICATSFFRNRKAFHYIETSVIPTLLGKLATGEELRVWIPGCSTGEEAYSIAMLIDEHRSGVFKHVAVKIFATDIDAVSLDFARKGVYPLGIVKEVSLKRIEKYFIKEGDHYRIRPEIRKMIFFAQHNLDTNAPYCNMHFVSCRNVLIYMKPALQKKVFAMLIFGLKKDGCLFLGSGENPVPLNQRLEVLNKKWKIYTNLETKKVAHFETFLLPDLHFKKSASSLLPIPYASSRHADSITEAVNLTLISQHNCLVCCIDHNNKIIKIYGDRSKYLLQKGINLSLAELLPGPLAIAFSVLKSKVLKTNEKAGVSGIKVKSDERTLTLSLSVSALEVHKMGHRLLMIVINEDPATSISIPYAAFWEKDFGTYAGKPKNDLENSNENSHDADEKLSAYHKYIQAFEEASIFTNEQMQSVNEEMRSVNEELRKLNKDYSVKNKELMYLNDHLNNYF